MSQVVVKFDNQLKQSDIVIPLVNGSKSEEGDNYTNNQPEIQQTKVHGIIAPLIAVNGIVVDFDAVKEFSLKSISSMPIVTIIFQDRFDVIRSINSPGSDNELRIEILPKFDKIYKKINLTFYISNIRINGDIVHITGLYKLQSLHSSIYKSFGKISTYELTSIIAKETGLGFASNVDSSNDARYIYSDNKSYIDLINREITHSGTDYIVFDWWIDYWNNLNLVDIYERYNATDPDDDLKIWITSQLNEYQEDVEIETNQVVATVTNHPIARATELFSYKYDLKNRTGANASQGTDKMYASYSLKQNEYTDKLVQDGDVKHDVFTRYEYLGEVYGDYNYLLADKLRTSFLQKINNESIEVSLPSPTMALMRGHRVNFAWYLNDTWLDNKMDALNELDATNKLHSNVGDESTYNSNDGGYKLDKQVSGQYLITGTHIRFSNGQWEYILILNRPTKQKLLKYNNE